MKIAQGDNVIVMAGKDKGKTGTILRVLHAKNRVIVAGINMRTKHIKRTQQQAGQKIRYEASIHASNIMIVDPKTKKPARIGHQIDEKTGKKVRIAKKSGTVLTRGVIAKPAKTDAKAEGATKEEKAPAQKSAKKESTTVEKVSGPKKAPFWKKLGFGSGEMSEGEDPTPGSTPGAEQASHHPGQETHIRPGSRGS